MGSSVLWVREAGEVGYALFEDPARAVVDPKDVAKAQP